MKPYYERNGITIYCGDCREILPLLPDKVDLVLTDPPYNIGHDWWDRIVDYESWLIDIFKSCQAILRQNGTLWFFHMNFTVLADLDIKLRAQTSFRHRQFITLDKGLQSIAGRTSDRLRTFPRATEYLQFYSFEDQTGAEQLSDEYHAVNPMAKYLKSEFSRAGVTNREIAALFPSCTGGMTGCVSNWLLGLNFPTRQQYEIMRAHLNHRQEYEYLRQEYEDLRYPFHLPMAVTDVWQVNCYKDNGTGHSSSKPFAPVERVVDTVTDAGGLVLDPFLGSGTTAVAAKKLGRKCIGIEIEEKYCEIAVKRLSQEVMDLKC